MKARLELTTAELRMLESFGFESGVRKKRDGMGHYLYVDNVEMLHRAVRYLRYQDVKHVPQSYSFPWNTPFVKAEVLGLDGGAYAYDERLTYWRRIIAGDGLTLRREAGNGSEPNAIAVFCKRGNFVGYVQKDLADQIAPLLDAGSEFDVVAVENNSRSWSLDVLIVGADLPADLATIAPHPHAGLGKIEN